MAERVDVPLDSRQQWRQWLADNAGESRGAWAVTWRKGKGPVVSYNDLVEEALAVGWVDSRPRKVDDERTALLMTPRRPGSGWSRPNKERIARLRTAGLMRPAGEAAVTAAEQDGSWTALDEVEDGVEPDDLAAALDAYPDARREWDAFPRSAKRGILEWISTAKKAETRARRVAETAELAARGERANSWPRPGATRR